MDRIGCRGGFPGTNAAPASDAIRPDKELTMSDIVTVTGLVATPPRHVVTAEGLPITTFRLASTQRRFDRKESKWVDSDTNWFTVTAFRHLAQNIAGSIAKGQRVVVTGRLRIRDWTNGETHGRSVEIDAEALGHDLSWGTATFVRTIASAVARDAAGFPEAVVEPDAQFPDDPAEQADSPAEPVPLPF
jgi:single-strand DNA-binding protein